MTLEAHPIERFRSILASDFVDDLPVGVHPIDPWCPEPQFFPGGSGMPTQMSWEDVIPGSCGHPEALPAAEGRDVMVVGNFQATRASYARVAAGSSDEFSRTWRSLRFLLAAVSPQRTFLTNAHIGLPDSERKTGPFPTSPSHLARCRRLLAVELSVLRPRTVVCLGSPAAQMLASTVAGLECWSPWPGFGRLSGQSQVVGSCDPADVTFTCVAVRHPSAVLSSEDRLRDAEAITAAVSPYRVR